MNPEELNRFLASVRKTRFVDYLDPMGETAHEAFERRLKWAARTRNDPAHAEEAEFLLRHATELRKHLTQEQLESDEDWVESTSAGSEWGNQSFGWAPSGGAQRPGRAGQRSTPAGAAQKTGRAAQRSTPAGAAQRPGRAPQRSTPAPARRTTSDPAQARVARSRDASVGQTKTPQPSGRQPQASGRSPEAAGRQPQAPGRSPQPSGRQPQAPGRQRTSRAAAESPTATPATPRTGIMRLEDLTDPPAAPRGLKPGRAGRLVTPPGAAGRLVTPPGPAGRLVTPPGPTGRRVTPPPADADLSDELIRTLSSSRMEAPSYTPAPADRSGLEEHEWVDQTAAHTPAPSVARSVPSPIPARPRQQTPVPGDSPRRALDIKASRSGTVERERATRPKKGPSPKFIVLAALAAAASIVVMIWSGALTGSSEPEEERVAALPPPVEPLELRDEGVAGDAEDGLASVDDEEADLASEEGGEEDVDDAVADAEAPDAAAAAAQPTRTPSAPPAQPASPPPTPAKPPPAMAKASEPKPTPPPAPAARPPEPSKPAPPPEQVAEVRTRGIDRVVEPPQAVSYPQLTGMWIGLAASKSFQLEIDSQSGGSFSGIAQVMNDAGEWMELRILGNVEPDGSLRFSQMGGGAAFSGRIDGIRASGSVRLTPNAEPAKWSVIQ